VHDSMSARTSRAAQRTVPPTGTTPAWSRPLRRREGAAPEPRYAIAAAGDSVWQRECSPAQQYRASRNTLPDVRDQHRSCPHRRGAQRAERRRTRAEAYGVSPAAACSCAREPASMLKSP
jgi:hypothetical protein